MALTRPRAHQLSDVTAKKAVRVVAAANITLAGSAPATVDGVSLTLDDRILVTAQSSGAENGIYRVTSVGSGSNGTWVRARDSNQAGEITAGMTCMVSEGSTYADTFWKLTTDGAITIGSTALTFEQHSGGGGSPGGSDTQVQFNDGDSFGGDAGLTYNKTTDALTVAGTVTATSYTGNGSALTDIVGASAGGVIYENSDDITSNYTLTTGKNGMSVGPITIADGITVTVPSGQRWVIL